MRAVSQAKPSPKVANGKWREKQFPSLTPCPQPEDSSPWLSAVLFMPIKILLPFFRIWIFLLRVFLSGAFIFCGRHAGKTTRAATHDVLSNVRREVFVDAPPAATRHPPAGGLSPGESLVPRRKGWKAPEMLRNWTHMLRNAMEMELVAWNGNGYGHILGSFGGSTLMVVTPGGGEPAAVPIKCQISQAVSVCVFSPQAKKRVSQEPQKKKKVRLERDSPDSWWKSNFFELLSGCGLLRQLSLERNPLLT